MEEDEAIEEAIGYLEDAEEELQEAIRNVDHAYSVLPRGARAERVRQIKAQLEIALGGDNDWLGGSSYTIDASLRELRGQDED